MSVHSGKFAVINGVDTLIDWSINETNAPARGIASNTAFGPFRRRGVLAWTGNYNKYGGGPLHMPGDFITLSAYAAPDTDVAGTAGILYGGLAIVDSVGITWDWSTGVVIKHAVAFSGHLALSRTSGTLSDATTPDLPDTPTSLGLKWISGLGDISSPNSLPNITTVTLTFTAANQAYVNSSTVIAGKLWTGRKFGTIDWTMAATIQDNVRGVTGQPEVGDDIKIKLYINATEFFELWWGHIGDYTGLVASRETGAILQATMNAAMNGRFTDGTEGKIVLPDTTEWWPPAASLILPMTVEEPELSKEEQAALDKAPEGAFVRPARNVITGNQLKRLEHESSINAVILAVKEEEAKPEGERDKKLLPRLEAELKSREADFKRFDSVTREPVTGSALRQRRAPPAPQASAPKSLDAGGSLPDGNRPKDQ